MKSRNGSSSLTGPPRDFTALSVGAVTSLTFAASLAFGARAGPGGGAIGTGIGWLASLLADRRAGAFSAAVALALRLTAPFTGTRLTKTQPTCGTGLPPTRRPSSNNHG